LSNSSNGSANKRKIEIKNIELKKTEKKIRYMDSQIGDKIVYDNDISNDKKIEEVKSNLLFFEILLFFN
jgi:hypothetical protein